MTNVDDIFSQGTEGGAVEWFYFKNVGDRIAGTFVDVQEGVDGYGNAQYIISLLRDGKTYLVGIKKTHTVLVDKLSKLRLGQIVGLSFDEEKPNPGKAPTKIVNPISNPSMVDEKWISAKLAADARFGLTPEQSLRPNFGGASATVAAPAAPVAPVAATPVATAAPVAPVAPAVPVAPVATAASPISSDLLATIKTLVVNKGILTDAATDDDVRAKVEEISGLPFTAENGPAIINKIAVAGF